MKKAQGLSITVIIVAVIALLVLVVLALVFTGGLGRWGLKVGECENKGGKCAFTCNSEAEGTLEYPTEFPEWKCPEVDGQQQKCCVKIVT
jgi:hypothetical protein